MSNYKLIYFNEKTTFEGYSRKLKIEILKRDYDGVAKKASIGAVLSVDGDVIKKTSVTLSFMATFDTEFEDLLNDGTMFKVRITLDSRIIFVGFIDADSFERDYTTSKNYRLEFIARDRLGALEDSKISLDWVKMPFIDLDSFITQILEPTKLNLPLLENIGLSAQNTTTQLRLLGQIHVNTQCTRVDEDKTNLDYLEELLSALNCSIQQKDGSWFVEEATVKTDRVKVFKKDIHLLHSSAKQTTQKGLKSIEVKQKLQSAKNIYKAFPSSDNDFIKVEQKPRSDMWFCYAPGWTIYNNSYMLRSFGVGAESFKVVNRNEYGLTPLNVSTIIDIEKTDNSVEVVFESAVASADTDLRPIAFDIYCGDKMLTNDGWVPKTDETKNLVFKINGYTQGSPTFQKLTVVADGIPYATGLEIFYRTEYVDHKGIEVHEQYQQSYTLPSEKQLNLTVNEKNTQKVKEEIKFGQAPDFPNAFHNFLGGFFDEKKKPLINWKHRNDLKPYDLLQVVTDTHIWANARKRSISAVLSWNYDLFTNVEIEGIRYTIKGVDSWDLGINELSVELEELNDYIEGAVPVTEPAIVGDAQNLKMMGSSETNYLTYTSKGTATPIRIASLETATDDYIEQAYIIADTYNSTDSKRVRLSDIGNKTGSEHQDFKTKNLAVHGDLEVYGEIISKPSVEIPIDDAWIKLNNGNSEVDAGIKIDLGDGTTSNLYRKASNDTWYIDDNELYHRNNLNIDTVDFKAKDITANSLKTRTFETVADGAKIFDNTVYHAGNLNRSDVDFKAKLLYANSLTIHNHTKPTILTRISNEKIYAIEYGVKAHDLKINSDNIIATPTGLLYSTASIANIHKSPNFQNGFLGQGHNFDNGVGELDTLTVRKTMNVYEMMINKVRSIGGEFLISAANGKISKVISQLNSSEATVEFDIDTEFVIGDIVRCQTWTGSSLKYYLGYITDIYDSKKVRIQRIEGDITAISAGDELIQQGNTKHDSGRQNLLNMSSKTGRYSIFQGVNSANLNGKLKGAFGDLKGITDTDFGNLENVGLYCDNVYLKGKMLLSAGSSISFADVTGAENEVTKITNDTVTASYINGLTCDFKQGRIGGFQISRDSIYTTQYSAGRGINIHAGLNSIIVRDTSNGHHTFVGQTYDYANGTYTGNYGISIGHIAGKEEYFRADNKIRRIAGWDFNEKSIYKSYDVGYNMFIGIDRSLGLDGTSVRGFGITKDAGNRMWMGRTSGDTFSFCMKSDDITRIEFNQDGSGRVASSNFTWNKQGDITAKNITATNVNLSGVINAESGTFSKWTIGEDGLKSEVGANEAYASISNKGQFYTTREYLEFPNNPNSRIMQGFAELSAEGLEMRNEPHFFEGNRAILHVKVEGGGNTEINSAIVATGGYQSGVAKSYAIIATRGGIKTTTLEGGSNDVEAGTTRANAPFLDIDNYKNFFIHSSNTRLIIGAVGLPRAVKGTEVNIMRSTAVKLEILNVYREKINTIELGTQGATFIATDKDGYWMMLG